MNQIGGRHETMMATASSAVLTRFILIFLWIACIVVLVLIIKSYPSKSASGMHRAVVLSGGNAIHRSRVGARTYSKEHWEVAAGLVVEEQFRTHRLRLPSKSLAIGLSVRLLPEPRRFGEE